MFGSRENKRKAKKMKEEGSSGKTPAHCISIAKSELPPLQTIHKVYIMPMIRKITKTSKLQLLHQGYFRKNCKKKGQTGSQMSNGTKIGEQIFSQCENFALVQKLHVKISHFLASSALLSFFSSSFLLIFFICNAKFDSNSSCLDRLNKIWH